MGILSASYPSLRGKRVVVTGGGSGIGAAIVDAFARQAARVTFLDIADAESKELERSRPGGAAEVRSLRPSRPRANSLNVRPTSARARAYRDPR